MRPPASVFVAVLTLLLTGCLGGEPRRPTRPPGSGEAVQEDEPFLAGRDGRERENDRWSVDAMLPRSGDPARPNASGVEAEGRNRAAARAQGSSELASSSRAQVNVKAELSVVDVRSARGLFVQGGVRGSLVRGVVNLRATLAAGARSNRAHSSTTQFVVVQAGQVGTLQVSRQLGPFVGATNAIAVHVVGVDAKGAVDLDLAPYTSTTSVPGEQLTGATRVRVLPGQAVVIGGTSSSYDVEGRSLGGYRGASGSRETLVLLHVDVLG